MKKLKLGALITAGVLALSSMPVYGADKITVKVDGKEILFDQEPVIVNDRVMVPIRFVAEAMGWDVFYESFLVEDENGDFHREAFAYMNLSVEKYVDEVNKIDVGYSTFIWLEDGIIDAYCYAEGKEYPIKSGELNVKPVIINDRTLVGVRDIAEGIHADVEWEQDTRTVKITTNHPTLFPRFTEIKSDTYNGIFDE